MEKQFKAIKDLKRILPVNEYEKIIEAAQCNYPEYLLEMIVELDTIQPHESLYNPNFHGVLLASGYLSVDFDIISLKKDMQYIQLAEDLKREKIDNDFVIDDMWVDPAGGIHYGTEEDPAKQYE